MPTRTAEQQRAEKLLERIRERRNGATVIGEHQDDLTIALDRDELSHASNDYGLGVIETGVPTDAGFEHATGNNTGNSAGRSSRQPDGSIAELATERPAGIDFDIPPIEFDNEPIPEPAQPKSAGKKAKSSPKPTIPNSAPSSVPQAPDASLLSKLRSHSDDGALTNAEAAERTDSAVQVATLIGQILDAGLEALRKTHAETDVFEPDEVEAKMLAEWYLRRARTRPKTARRVRVATDLYDTYAVPAQYLIPRVLEAREILKEEGYTLRGR